MSNPYLAVLATPPRESFGGLAFAFLSAATAAMLNLYYAPNELRAEDAGEMIQKGKDRVPFPNKTPRSALKSQAFDAALSLAAAHIKAAYMFGALSRQLGDPRFADAGARFLRQLDDDTSSKTNEKDPEKIVGFYDQVMGDANAMLSGYKKRGPLDPEVQYILTLLGRQGERANVQSAQVQEEQRKAGAFELISTEKNQDTCFPGGKEEREAHAKLFAKIPSFLQEADPTASPPNCKQRIKPWVVPTGIGLGVGLAALLLFRRRRPQQTVIMIPGGAAGNSSQALTTR